MKANKRTRALPLSLLLIIVLTLLATAQQGQSTYLPLVQRPAATPTPTATPVPTPTATASPTAEGMMTEFRGLWVTRFDWTNFNSADPAKIEEIVNNAALAGFNVIFFQVRGAGDAYYTPGLEPWASRLTGTLGQNPGWDPLARLIEKAHARDIQVHAYLNTYPLWTGCEAPPDNTTPRHPYYALLERHGATDGKLNGLQWTQAGEVACNDYQRISPAALFADEHLLAVAKDLVQRYDVDGIHLDHIRYAGPTISCDPVSAERWGAPCFEGEGYEDWQRQQVTGTVRKFYEQIVPLKADLWLSAAVWPVYQDYWGWGARAGYSYYYQDSKAWVQSGIIDSISPMIYTGAPNCESDFYWTRERWETLVANFQQDSGGRFIVPGIGTLFCTDNDFAEIEARIAAARTIGTAGHAIYSYKTLLTQDLFDDLAAGPYAVPARVPDIPWHP